MNIPMKGLHFSANSSYNVLIEKGRKYYIIPHTPYNPSPPPELKILENSSNWIKKYTRLYTNDDIGNGNESTDGEFISNSGWSSLFVFRAPPGKSIQLPQYFAVSSDKWNPNPGEGQFDWNDANGNEASGGLRYYFLAWDHNAGNSWSENDRCYNYDFDNSERAAIGRGQISSLDPYVCGQLEGIPTQPFSQTNRIMVYDNDKPNIFLRVIDRSQNTSKFRSIVLGYKRWYGDVFDASNLSVDSKYSYGGIYNIMLKHYFEPGKSASPSDVGWNDSREIAGIWRKFNGAYGINNAYEHIYPKNIQAKVRLALYPAATDNIDGQISPGISPSSANFRGDPDGNNTLHEIRFQLTCIDPENQKITWGDLDYAGYAYTTGFLLDPPALEFPDGGGPKSPINSMRLLDKFLSERTRKANVGTGRNESHEYPYLKFEKEELGNTVTLSYKIFDKNVYTHMFQSGEPIPDASAGNPRELRIKFNVKGQDLGDYRVLDEHMSDARNNSSGRKEIR